MTPTTQEYLRKLENSSFVPRLGEREQWTEKAQSHVGYERARGLMLEYGEKRAAEAVAEERERLKEIIERRFIDFSAKTEQQRKAMNEGDTGFMRGTNDTVSDVLLIISKYE